MLPVVAGPGASRDSVGDEESADAAGAHDRDAVEVQHRPVRGGAVSSCGIEKLRGTVPVDSAADFATLRPSKQASVVDNRLPSGGPPMPSML